MHIDLEYPHQVEFEVPEHGMAEHLAIMETWLHEWEITFAQRPASAGAIRRTRFAFKDVRFAQAFQTAFGGALITIDTVAKAARTDAEDEDRYERLARAYPD